MYDDVTHFFKWKIENRFIAIVFCFFQLFVSSTSLAQHVYSLLHYRTIFSCHVNASFRNDSGKFLAYDIVIYDFGLFNFLLGTEECVANYLDGGYMRCLWCLSQVSCQLLVLYVLFFKIKWSYAMCPILLQQSVYSLGLIILTIATLPKLLNAFVARFTARFIKLISIFFSGMILTWFYTFTVWHYYWYLDRVENETKTRLKQERLLLKNTNFEHEEEKILNIIETEEEDEFHDYDEVEEANFNQGSDDLIEDCHSIEV